MTLKLISCIIEADYNGGSKMTEIRSMDMGNMKPFIAEKLCKNMPARNLERWHIGVDLKA